MARVTRPGFDYTRLDVDFWTDIKVRRAKKNKQGNASVEIPVSTLAPYVYMRLVTFILKENYFVPAESDIPFLLSEDLGFDEETVNECISILLNTGLLDKKMYDTYHILTSRGIQKQYNNLCDATRRKSRITENSEYSLLKESDTKIEESVEVPVEEPAQVEQEAVKPSDEDDELEIVAFFLFDRNFYKPQYQYQRLVNYNLTGGRNWASMNHQMRIAAASMWNQQTINGDPETNPRFGKCPAFRAVWKQIYQIAKDELKADKSVLKDMLDDGLEYRPKVNVENETIDALMCADSVTRLLVQNKDKFAPILKPLFDGRKMKFFQMAKKK